MIKFNAQNNTFVHNDSAAEGVEISNDYFHELINAQSRGFEIRADGRGIPIAVPIDFGLVMS